MFKSKDSGHPANLTELQLLNQKKKFLSQLKDDGQRQLYLDYKVVPRSQLHSYTTFGNNFDHCRTNNLIMTSSFIQA